MSLLSAPGRDARSLHRHREFFSPQQPPDGGGSSFPSLGNLQDCPPLLACQPPVLPAVWDADLPLPFTRSQPLRAAALNRLLCGGSSAHVTRSPPTGWMGSHRSLVSALMRLIVLAPRSPISEVLQILSSTRPLPATALKQRLIPRRPTLYFF